MDASDPSRLVSIGATISAACRATASQVELNSESIQMFRWTTLGIRKSPAFPSAVKTSAQSHIGVVKTTGYCWRSL